MSKNNKLYFFRKFYETENSNYCVKPEQIIPGFVYASSYTTFPIEKNWYRVRILEEVDSMTVKVSVSWN